MRRFFNTTGYCRPEDHYMIDPLRGIKPEIDNLLRNEQYFLIHAPRQTGKTTLLHALARQINQEGNSICVAFSIENAGYRSITVQDAMILIIRSLYDAASFFLPKNELPGNPDKYQPIQDLFYKYLGDWAKKQQKSVILLIDEIDSVWDDIQRRGR
jgi:Cdc6-like AAA superfamily ATPase